jgi:hypothetical protein
MNDKPKIDQKPAEAGALNRGHRAGVKENGEVIGSGAGAGGGGNPEEIDSDSASGGGGNEMPKASPGRGDHENSNT